MSDERKRQVEAVKLSDNDVHMLLEAAELNAGSKSASIHQKQIYSALKELYDIRKAASYVASIP